MLNRIRSRRGYTFLELTIVCAIIGVLATLAIPNFIKATHQAKQSEAAQLLKAVYKEITIYQIANNALPTSLNQLTGAKTVGQYFTITRYEAIWYGGYRVWAYPKPAFQTYLIREHIHGNGEFHTHM